MKTLRTSLFVLTAVALSAVAASAPKTTVPDVGTNYVMNATFPNNPPSLADATGVPTLSKSDLEPYAFGVVMTDGGGKIDGVQDLTVEGLTDLGPFNRGVYIGDISGSITTVKSNPVVKMTIKGNGYVDGTNGTGASGLSLTFASTSGLATGTSAVGPFTNDITVIVSNSVTGLLTTNSPSHYQLVTNINGSPSYQILAAVVRVDSTESFTNTVNGTNIVTQNDSVIIQQRSTPFGTVQSTNQSRSFFVGTSNFTQFPIGYTTFFESVGTNIITSSNAVFGIDIAAVPGLIAAFVSTNTFTLTNPVEISSVLSLTTNNVVGSTNTSVSTGLPVTSNAWNLISGTVKGSVTAPKQKPHKFDGETATLADTHTLYSAFTGTNFSTNVVTTTNGIVTNVTATVTQYVEEQSEGGSLGIYSLDSLSAKVVQFGKNLWMAADGANFSGKGTLDPKKLTYKATLKGVAQSRGSSLNLTGTNGPLYVDYHALTNVIAVTNLVAVPLDFGFVTNTSFFTNLGFSQNSVTNGAGSTNVVVINSTFEAFVPPLIITNIVPNGIKTVTASGKVMGQTVPPTTGSNPNATFPPVEVE
jgi:hypothetical protein